MGFGLWLKGTKFDVWKHRRFNSVYTIGQWSKVCDSDLLVEIITTFGVKTG